MIGNDKVHKVQRQQVCRFGLRGFWQLGAADTSIRTILVVDVFAVRSSLTSVAVSCKSHC